MKFLFKIYCNLIVLIFVILLNSGLSFGSCLNLLKLQVDNKSLLKLTNFKFKKHLREKKEQLEFELERFLFGQEALDSKSLIYHQRLMDYLSGNQRTYKFTKELNLLYEAVHDPQKISDWANNLYLDVIVELYVSGTFESIREYEATGNIKDEFIIKVMQARSVDGGFSGQSESIAKVYFNLEDDEFGDLVASRKFIIDYAFSGSAHGHLPHILQVDFYIYQFKNNQIDPLTFGDLYQWIGENHKYKLSNGKTFNSLEDVWGAMFDSFEQDISRVDYLNETLKKYFKWIF